MHPTHALDQCLFISPDSHLTALPQVAMFSLMAALLFADQNLLAPHVSQQQQQLLLVYRSVGLCTWGRMMEMVLPCSLMAHTTACLRKLATQPRASHTCSSHKQPRTLG